MLDRADRLIDQLRRGAATPVFRLGVFAVIALCAAWRPLGEAGAMNVFRDSQLVHTYEEVAVRSVLDYGEAPLWNPWTCGGLYALGNPQTRFTSPTLLLSLAMGARRAEPVILFLFLLLGMEGMFRFARLRAGLALGPFLAAPFFALGGYGAISWTLGWMVYVCGFLIVPWALYGTARLARGDARGAVPLIASVATMLGTGGSYPLALTAVFAGLEAVRGLVPRLRRPRAALRSTGLLVAAALFTVGILAVRLWPVMETLGSAPRVMGGRPGHGLPGLLQMLFTPAVSATGMQAIFQVGPVVALFALLAVLRWRKGLAPLLLFGFAVWCATGYTGESPYTWLRRLPVFEGLRYPERYLFLGAVYLSEAAAIGISTLLALSRRRAEKRVTPLVVCVVAVLGWGYGVYSFEVLTRRSELGPMPTRVEQAFAQARGNRWIAGYYPFLNRGSLNCGEAYPVWMSPALRGDLPQEEYLEDATAGTVRRAHWSPNRLGLEVELSRPAFVRVNQNWHPGWRSSVGEVVSRDGLLSVSLPEGRHKVELRFRPRSALAGGLVSLLGVGALVGWLLVARRRPRAAVASGIALGLVPLVAWAGLAWSWPEAKTPPIIQNPDGSPLLVEALPADAIPLNLRFEEPIELVAARIPSAPDAKNEVPMELYWRVHGAVPRSVGVFVHVSGPDGKRHGADHEVLGGTYFFKDAPRGMLLRDAFRVNTSDWKSGEWKVVLGLWHAAGDGSRLEVRTAGGEALRDGAVEAGKFVVP